MIPQDLWYDFPFAAYLLPFVFLILILFWWLFLYRRKNLLAFSSEENLNLLLIPRSKFLYFLKVFLFSSVWLLSTFALMQPQGNGYYPQAKDVKKEDLGMESKLKSHDVIFLIDASASMSINDSRSQKTRLALSKEIADEIASGLTGESAALYAFTSIATKMSPSTPDLFFVRMMLRQISINEGGVPGTDFLQSLKMVSEKYFKPSTTKLTTLIILSDGGDTRLETLSGIEKSKAMDQILNLLGDTKSLNLRVFTIGMGSLKEEIIQGVQFQEKPVYSKRQDELLKLLSEKGRGAYYEANLETPIEIAKNIFKRMAEDDPFLKDSKNVGSRKELLVYQLFYQVPLGLALLLISLYIVFPDISILSIFRLSSILFCCFHLHLLNGDEGFNLKRAQMFFEAGNLSKAESLYNEMLKKNLEPFEKAVVMYNQGTTLLNQNELQKAVEVLDTISLSGNPPPFLTRRIKTNLALAKFRQAVILLSSGQDDQNILEKAAYLLKTSETDIKAAIKAECELQEIEGRATCSIPSDLNELSLAIHGHLEKLSKLINLENLGDPQNAASLQHFRKKITEIYDEALKIKPLNIKQLNMILEKAIEAQHETLMMTRNLNHLGDVKEESRDALKFAETQVLKIADLYLSETYALQHHLYETTGLAKKPWNEILPLYNKGYQAANEALDLISEKLEKASLNQEDAIKYWKEALRKSSDDQSKEENEPKKVSQAEEKQSKSEKALQTLQEMENGDQKQKRSTKTNQQEVERPW